jgi:hypothetical protein
MNLDSVNHSTRATHLTRSNCEVFNAVDDDDDNDDDDDVFGMTVKRLGMSGLSEEDEGTDCADGDSDNDW